MSKPKDPEEITNDSSIAWQWVITDLVLSNQTVLVTTNYQARDTISAGNGYRVQSPGQAALQAGKLIRLTPGFRATTGGLFRAGVRTDL